MNTLEDDLKALGNTAEEVRDNLIKLGIKGNRESCGNCPIANYLLYKGYTRVSVGSTMISVRTGYCDNPPVAICEFIRLFDQGSMVL
jgi:hypothetical protein